jgi:serine/threonine protein kinase
MPLINGTPLGPYEIVAPLGAGGMGEVYKARDTRLNRTVAIKVLRAHIAGDPEAKQRFEREAQTVAGLDFLVMEHLEGVTLEDRLAKGPSSASRGHENRNGGRRLPRQSAPQRRRPSRP